MTGKPASKRCTKKDVLNAIMGFVAKNGYIPSYDEIGRLVGLAKSGVSRHVENLIEDGYLTRIEGISRGLRLTKPIQMLLPLAREIMDKVIEIPIRGMISAGHPINIPDDSGFDPDFTIAIRSSSIPTHVKIEELFALQVKGDSMVDAYVHDGDIVVLQKIEMPEHGDMVAAWLPKERAITLKKFKYEEKGISLHPANVKYKPILIDNPEDILIQGKVIAVQRLIFRSML